MRFFREHLGPPNSIRPSPGKSRSSHSGQRTERSPSSLRMQTHEYNRFLGAGRVTLPISLHHRVQFDMRRYFIRHVEEHIETAPEGDAQLQTGPERLQKKSSPLFGRLCQSAQRLVCWDFVPGVDYYLPHTLFRVNITGGIRWIGCD